MCYKPEAQARDPLLALRACVPRRNAKLAFGYHSFFGVDRLRIFPCIIAVNFLLLSQATLVHYLPIASIAPLLDESRKLTISRVGAGRAIEGHVAILEAVRAHDSQAAVRVNDPRDRRLHGSRRPCVSGSGGVPNATG